MSDNIPWTTAAEVREATARENFIWPTVAQMQEASAAGRESVIRMAQAEREQVLTNWRNSVRNSLCEAYTNKFEDESVTVAAPTPNILLAQSLLPILVAWLKGVLPGFNIVGDEGGNCVFIVISWKDESV